MKFYIEEHKGNSVDEGKIEIVERKGLGHPDYMADSIAEAFSRNLSKYYIEHFGTILHHNVDKLEIVGGNVDVEFGGGKFLKPMLIFFSGRATAKVGNENVPLAEIAKQSAKNFIKENYRFVNPDDEKQIKFMVETKSGSTDLVDVYGRKDALSSGKILANDTSIGIGYAPLTITERTIKELEMYLNSKKFKEKYPYSGEDIKIMGTRIDKKLDLTIAMGFVSKFVNSESDYWEYKGKIMEEIRKFVESKISDSEISLNEKGIDLGENGSKGIYLNTADVRKKGEEKGNIYLTLTGMSAEQGDDGAVGRGNRVNGIIPFQRSLSMEAVAGKNPVNHIGKLYNVMAFRLANKVYEELSNEIKQVEVKLLSQIGISITDPYIAYASIIPASNVKVSDLKGKIKRIFEDELTKEKFENLRKEFVDGKIEVC